MNAPPGDVATVPAIRTLEPAEILDAGSTLRVISVPHPFSTEREDRIVRASATLAEILEAAGIPPGLDARVFIDGHGPYPREQWPFIRPKPGRVVTARAIPGMGGGRGGGGKNVLGIVLMIAVAVAAIYFAPILATQLGFIAGTTAFTVAAGLISAGINIIGSLVISAIAPPPQPKLSQRNNVGGNGGQESPTLSITGTQNRANPYGVIPRVYGTFRMFPTSE